MKQEKKRIYNSESRDAQAAQTRSDILEAAKELFQTEGFDRVTINKLAQAADVSMPTIYALFNSKRGVLQALIDDAFPPEQFAEIVLRKQDQISGNQGRFVRKGPPDAEMLILAGVVLQG